MYDLALQTVEDQRESTDIFKFDVDDQQTLLTTGLRMMVQNWTKHFLTQQGTHVADPEYGTSFPELIGSNVGSEAQVFLVIDRAVSQTNTYIKRIQRENNVDDERRLLESGDIDEFNASNQGTDVSATILLTNQASDRVRVSTRDGEVLVSQLN